MTEFRRTPLNKVAGWRLEPQFWDRNVRVKVPALNPDKTMDNLIFPPVPGVLPAYKLVIEHEEKEQFRKWVLTLSPADQKMVADHMTLERIS